MRKVRVDFKVYCSVVVEIHDDDDDEVAIEKAEGFLYQNGSRANWEFDDNTEETDEEPDVKLEKNL